MYTPGLVAVKIMDTSLNSSEPTSRLTRSIGRLSRVGNRAAGFVRIRILIAALCSLLCLPSLSFAIDLQADTDVATAGYYQLKWKSADDNAPVELQEADNARFENAEPLYQGRDRARVVTGRSDGTYYYRARTVDDGAAGAWSDIVKVQVKHHPLSRALGFFIVGAIVFLSIVIAILIGNRRYHSKESQ
ncbi:fibronectin type III domain-containing protein [Thiohalophilus sp.]|uniref:fibronectin type III domain-containing protein n=1 Tax=Thiohalophilus sp. TaxID=3028392 RepID=UPI00286FBF81|nr:fibronectin type III domain-containing protein [Thiohalophilus sp.]